MTQQHMAESQAKSQSEPQMEPPLDPQVESQPEPQPEAIDPRSLIFYQAVGLIQAELQVNDAGAYVFQWHDRTWSVYLRKKILDIAETLTGQLLYWRVYPHTTHTKDGFVVNRFTVVSQPTTPATPIDGQFKLAGCWESLPRWQSEPVRKSFFSVYRNPERDKRPPSKSYNQHYALNWDEEPFVPAPGKVLPWHAILAKLQPDGIFDFVELVDGPKPAPDRIKRSYNANFDRAKSNRNADSNDGLEKTPRISPPPPVLGKKATPESSDGVTEDPIEDKMEAAIVEVE